MIEVIVEVAGVAVGLALQKDTYSGRAPLAATRRAVLMAAMDMAMAMVVPMVVPGADPMVDMVAGNYVAVDRALYGVKCHTQ